MRYTVIEWDKEQKISSFNGRGVGIKMDERKKRIKRVALLFAGAVIFAAGSGIVTPIPASGQQNILEETIVTEKLERNYAKNGSVSENDSVSVNNGASVNSGVSEHNSISGNNAEAASESVSANSAEPPVKVKGIYVSGPIAGHEKIDDLIALVDETELNAMVIDVKNDEGRVTYHMDNLQVQELGADVNYIRDIDALVQKCKEKDIYLIARIVAFKDPYLAEQRPELCVNKKDGTPFRDKNNLAWVNPYKQEVWDYLISISSQAAADGFDEIQYDYIRFSTDLNPEQLDFGPEAEEKSRTDIITEFTDYAYAQLSPLGVKVSADVYGTVIQNEIDQDLVGQRYAEMAKHLDYICPMVYPSHYGPGNFNLAVPDAQPYETVYKAMLQSQDVLSEIPEENRAGVRVWLQSFTAGWLPGHISYGPKEIRDQIRGAYEAGYEEWILWNASVNYQRETLMTDKEALAEKRGWEAERRAKAAATAREVAAAREADEAEKAAVDSEADQTGEAAAMQGAE